MTFGFRDRLRLAWELTWPLALLDLAAVVVIHGAMDAKGQTPDLVWALVSFFAVAPFVVRWALAREGIVRVSHGVAAPFLGYQESLKIVWLLTWRTIPLGLLALLLVSAVFRATGTSLPHASMEDPLVNAFGLSMVDTVASLVLYPLLIPGMLKKRYRSFHLEVRGRK